MAGDYRQARLFVVIAQRIDQQCDTWQFWEKHFQREKDKAPRRAVEILAFMVGANHDRQKLREAARLYLDLEGAQAGRVPPPPTEIQSRIDEAHFEKRLADAEQAIKNGRYDDARTKLAYARNRFPSLWSGSANADKLEKVVRFNFLFETVRRSFVNGELDDAQAKVTECASNSMRGQASRKTKR